MTIIAAIVSDITFLEVGMSLIVLGIAERIVINLPKEMVGPGGWLLDTGTAR